MSRMRLLPPVVVAPAVVGLAAGIAVWVRWLMARSATWTTRILTAVPVHAGYWEAQAARPGEFVYVAIGDSTAQGLGASRPDRSYVGVLAHRIRQRTGRRWRVVNLSVFGSTVFGAYRDQLPQLPSFDADVVTVAIGANNIPEFETARFEKDLRRLLDLLPKHAIVAELPSFYLPPREGRVRRANEVVRRLVAERGLTLVPLHRLTWRQGVWGVLTQFSGDLFHPNDRGYRVWARAFAPAVEARLRELGALRPAPEAAD